MLNLAAFMAKFRSVPKKELQPAKPGTADLTRMDSSQQIYGNAGMDGSLTKISAYD